MTMGMKTLLGFFCVVLVVGVWMGRYDVKSAGPTTGAVILDRWVGTVWYCETGNCYKRYPLKQF
jgi:hypothetical protein